MKARGAAVQGALAVVGLVAAYVTWQREPEQSKGEVVVLDVSKSSLEKVRYEDGMRFIELYRQGGEGGPVTWLRQGMLEAAAVAQADGGVSTPPAPPKEVRGNERAEKLYERFAPLRAARAFGALPPERKKEVGLAESKRRLEVTAAGVTRSFKVSTSAMGVGTPFVEDEQGRAFLLGGTLISELDPSSQQLVDRRLHAFRAAEVDAFVVKADGKSREFVQSGAEIPATTKVAPKETPDKPDELARNWHDRVWSRLVVTEVYGRGQLPPEGEPKASLRIEYSQRGAPKGWLEIAKGEKTAYARSEQTANWVALHGNLDDILTEGKKLVSP
ncbi:MAG: hypothetical protein ACOZIN_05265 [Myxococcota bacterium]